MKHRILRDGIDFSDAKRRYFLWIRSRLCISTSTMKTRPGSFIALLLSIAAASCAPRITRLNPNEGTPGTLVSLSMEYLVGWPRVEIGGHMIEWSDLKLLGAKAESAGVRGEELTWIEDKILQFRIPALPPGDYPVIIHDDKGPPGEPVYSALETTAYAAFPPVWPFLFRSNQTQITLRILPSLD